MAETTMSIYKVTFERDETGWWQARIPDVSGCHTQGRTVDEARRRIREALALFVEHARDAELVDDVRLPVEATKAIRVYKRFRKQAVDLEAQAAAAAREAVKVLQDAPLNMSARDTGAVLGLSHQRVHQLATSRGRKRGRKR
jgi:predicted RNase H-like HicB family nuclease